MPVFKIEDKQILFVRIPRAGGDHIFKWLEQSGVASLLQQQEIRSLRVAPQHLPYEDIVSLLGEIWDYSFAVVCNPYQRIEREFFNSLSEKQRLNPNVWPDFTRWVVLQLNNAHIDPFYQNNHFCPQSELVSKDIDIFRLEDGLMSLQDKLSKLIDLKCSAIEEYPLEEFHQHIRWSNDSIKAVNRAYQEDFEMFGYERKAVRYLSQSA